MMDFTDDFDFLHHAGSHINVTPEDDKENFQFDFPLFQSTPSLSRSHPQQHTRAFDYPSIKKHYGLVTLADYQLPIVYRLINDSLYIPYIRFSYVLNIFEHSSYKKFAVNIRNLPVVEMTPTERVYYDQISSFTADADWSNYQLLSVSMLDGVLAIIHLAEHFHSKCDPNSLERRTEWQDALNSVRREAHDRWILEEKVVLARLTEKKEVDSACISSTSIAKRRALFEQRVSRSHFANTMDLLVSQLDLSIVDEVGGFVQIDAFVYPFVKNPSDNQIYIHLGDIRQSCIPVPSCLISYVNSTSPMFRAYSIVAEQAQSNFQWNSIHHGRNNDLSKYLPPGNRADEELSFLPIQTFLHLFVNKQSNLHVQFVQVFETASLHEIESNYKTNLGRQFVMMGKRQGGLVNNRIPCLISSHLGRQILSIPSESQTRRAMSNDERLYLNMILLYYGLWKNLLSKRQQWYLEDIDGLDKENIQVEMLFGHGLTMCK